MKSIKNYIDKLVTKKINEMLVPQGTLNLTHYITKTHKEDISVWDVILRFDVETVSFNFRYFDEINHKLKYEKTSRCLISLISLMNDIPKDVVSVEAAFLNVWYMYKGKRELNQYRFTDLGIDYTPESITQIKKELNEFVYKHPEMKL